MEAITRKPFQGITNIMRFNWHFYLMALIAILCLCALQVLVPMLRTFIVIIIGFIIVTTLISLGVSFYVYDLSGLYSLDWLNSLAISPDSLIININAGFDETSGLLAEKFPLAQLLVYDFYDPQKHTEVSIKRARKAYPPYPGIKAISTGSLPILPASVDAVFCILSAHEIRDPEERSNFFHQLASALKTGGRIVVAEHLRDLPNFLAYTVGFFHFHSKKAWLRTFNAAGLQVESQQKITPFITAYFLCNNGNAS